MKQRSDDVVVSLRHVQANAWAKFRLRLILTFNRGGAWVIGLGPLPKTRGRHG